MAVQDKVFTADDLWQLSHQNTGKRYELDKGVLIETAPTGDMHGVVTNWMAFLIMGFVEAHELGEVVAAETGFQLFNDPDTVRAADVAFIAKARLTPLTGKYYQIVPDFVVEVISPSESASDVNDKVLDYLAAGAKLVWLVYPKSRTVNVCTATNEGKGTSTNRGMSWMARMYCPD